MHTLFYDKMRNFADATKCITHNKATMTTSEYIQLKAFARIDGVLLALFWIGSFTLYIAGMRNPLFMMGGLAMAVSSPFFAATRVRRFRDNVRNGELDFKTAYLYAALQFFYSALLFAVAQFVYFQYLDNGYIASQVIEILNDSQSKAILQQNGMWKTMEEAVGAIKNTRAIDFALNYLVTNIIIGLVLGLPIAAYVRKQAPRQYNNQETK